MPTCQCPACQAQFQAAADRGALTACPKCQFKVRVPELSQEPSAAPMPGMVTCECNNCRLKFQVPETKTGTTQRCPECNALVEVVAQPRRAMRTWVLVAIVVLMILLIMMTQISILGPNANSAFGTVGASIGAATGN
jgi:uncharacterized paraquat-inducible protein A